MTKPIVRINPPTLPNSAEMGYSQISIVEPGRMAYISGQVAWQPNGEPVPEGLVEQMELVSKNARSALEAIGAKPEDVVIARVYMVNLTPRAPGRVDAGVPGDVRWGAALRYQCRCGSTCGARPAG